MITSDYNGTVQKAQETKRKKSIYKYTIPAGFALSTACIAARGFKKENKADTFIKTAQNCIRDYTNTNKRYWGKRIGKVSNKVMFPIIFGLGGLTNGLFIDWLIKIFRKE